MEWATGASAPAAGVNGVTYARYEPGQIPTGAVPLTAVVPGSTVYVRARSEQPGLFPSAWTGWETVSLTAWAAPTAVTVGSITNKSAVVSWSVGANTQDTVEVYVYPGTVAPANWQQYRWAVLPAGTTTTTLLGLTASTNYVVGVAFFDAISQVRGTMATATTFQTTNSASGVADRPAGFAVIEGVNDATLPQGVALGLWTAQGADQTVIERANNLTGPDRPSTYAEIAVVPSNTTIYIDPLPNNGTKYWYRIKHRTAGKTDSEVIPRYGTLSGATYSGLMAVATGIPATVERPSGTEAVDFLNALGFCRIGHNLPRTGDAELFQPCGDVGVGEPPMVEQFVNKQVHWYSILGNGKYSNLRQLSPISWSSLFSQLSQLSQFLCHASLRV